MLYCGRELSTDYSLSQTFPCLLNRLYSAAHTGHRGRYLPFRELFLDDYICYGLNESGSFASVSAINSTPDQRTVGMFEKTIRGNRSKQPFEVTGRLAHRACR